MSSLCQARSSERFKQVIETLEKHDDLNHKQLPGLKSLLTDIVDPKTEVSREDSVRGMLKVFWKSETDGTYSDLLSKYQPDEEARIRSFVEDGKDASEAGKDFQIGLSLGAREELPIIDTDGDGIPDDQEGVLERIGQTIHEVAHDIKEAVHSLWEDHSDVAFFDDAHKKEKMPTYINERFQNWGRTIDNVPHITCVPRTSHGIQEVVKYAKQKKMNVRASGYRHSWAPVYGRNGQILISTLGLHKATKIPNIESLPGSQFFEKHTELNSIEFVGKPQAGQKRLVRVGTAVTSQMLRRWCNAQKLDESSTLPINVIMVEITLGGSNAPICHGAGRRHTTLSDLVYAIEYVDANGEIRKLNRKDDADVMNAAAGCFGLMGIVTHITLELEPMRYAYMLPRKLPVMQAIPPPLDLKIEDIPEPLRVSMTDEQRAKWQAEFEDRAKNDFYSEWFWFPYTSKVWVNCWNVVEDGTGAVDYPSKPEIFVQFAETIAIQIIQRSEAFFNLQYLFPWAQATFISKMSLYAMPDITNPSDAIKTKLPNALHFRRAVQNVRVRDMEIEIPLLPKNGGVKALSKLESFSTRDINKDEINWHLVQKAWWSAILTAYTEANKKICPQRMPLEMRITGPSDTTMAPYRNHNLGSASIEVLTLEAISDSKIWLPYCQEILNHWMNLKDSNGEYLPSRPHFAKQWWGLKVRNQPMVEYMQEQYKDAIPEFKEQLTKVGEKHGWTLHDARERFSNDFFDQLIYDTDVGVGIGHKQAHLQTQAQAQAQLHQVLVKTVSQITTNVQEVSIDRD